MNIAIDDKDVQRIAEKVLEMLKPYLRQQEEDELLTIEQASEFLQRSKGQIYQWVSNSKHSLSDFPYKKQGKQLRFSRLALLKWCNKRQ